MERKDIINIIPQPKNEDVIVYDLDLKDLIDINVFDEFKQLLNDYKIKRENYILIEKELEMYQKTIDNIYLYNKSWTETDYIEMLQKEKKTYNTYFNEVKKIENNIDILEKKYKTINEQIKIQHSRETKEIETKKKNINNEIEDARKNIKILNAKIQKINVEKNAYLKQISDIEEDLELCNIMQKELYEKKFKCQYCGSIITNEKNKDRVNNMLEKKKQKNNQYLKSYKSILDTIEKDLVYHEGILKEHKIILKNNMEFKGQDYNFYIKKSIKILEMEAARDEIQKNILKYKKDYENNKQTKTKQYQELKDRIYKYEISIQNLQKIKESKKIFFEKNKIINNLKPILLEQNQKLKKYKKFIEIFYKIYEQKANDYFGNNIKFKLYKFNSFDFEEIFEIYYNDIKYTQLQPKIRQEVDRIIAEKISYLY